MCSNYLKLLLIIYIMFHYSADKLGYVCIQNGSFGLKWNYDDNNVPLKSWNLSPFLTFCQVTWFFFKANNVNLGKLIVLCECELISYLYLCTILLPFSLVLDTGYVLVSRLVLFSNLVFAYLLNLPSLLSSDQSECCFCWTEFT